jgi:hypothetical protein
MYIRTLLCLSLSVFGASLTFASTCAYAEQKEENAQPSTQATKTQNSSALAAVSQIELAPELSIVESSIVAPQSDAPPSSKFVANPESSTLLTPTTQALDAPNAGASSATSNSTSGAWSTNIPLSSVSASTVSEVGTPVLSSPAAPAALTSVALVTSSPPKVTKAQLASNSSSNKPKKTHRSAKDIDADQFDPRLPDESESNPRANKRLALEGSATYYDVSARFGERLHQLTKAALEQDKEYQKTAKAVDHYRTNVQRALRTTRDAVNYVYPYRGFSMSMEGSRVILDEKQKMNNLCVAELMKQRYWDEMHPKVMAQFMQIAQGLGMEKSEQADAVLQKGLTGLRNLTDSETAEATMRELSEWKEQLNVPEATFQQSIWDVESSERIYQNALKVSSDGDPLIHQVFKTVKKYDHGKVANMAAGAIEANLSALTILSGNPFASLAAEGANTAFVMTTGGPEENKILKELYFGRRLEIRRKRINDETQLALTNYQKALLTHNAPQLAMSEMVLSELVGPEKIAMVLEHDPVNDAVIAAPIELAKKDTK